jgi:glycine betaine/proline transport system ATP-binding protein
MVTKPRGVSFGRRSPCYGVSFPCRFTPERGGRFDGEVDADANLESLIARSDGDTAHVYQVRDNGEIIGQVEMKDLVKALVPRVRTEKGEE